MSASGRSRWWVESRRRSKRSISRLTSGSTEPSWSAMKIFPPGRVTRASSETASAGHADVVENAMAAHDVELRVAERERHDVALDEADVGGRVRAAGVEVVGTRVDADDLGDERGEGERHRPRPAAGVERDLVAGERAEQAPDAVGEIRRALLLQREPKVDAHASSPRERARELERLLARRDRPRCPLLVDDVEDTSDLGAGLETELVATHERRGRIGAPRGLDDAHELLRADVGERVERPRLRLRDGSDESRAATGRRADARGAVWPSSA